MFGNKSGLANRELQLMADRDVFADSLDRLVVDHAAGCAGDGIECFDQAERRRGT